MADPHRDLELLLAYADGQLTPAEQARAAGILAGDAGARALVALWRQASADLRADDGESPPESSLARLREIARTAAPSAASWLDRAAAFVAQLVYDSRAQAIAVRRAEAPTSIQLAYSVDDLEVDLTIERLAAAAASDVISWRVGGQLSGASGGRRIAACRAGTRDPVRETSIDDTGFFSLELEPGRFDFVLDLGDDSLVLADVEVP